MDSATQAAVAHRAFGQGGKRKLEREEELERLRVEMQMLEPGWPGLRNAFQQVVLFHPAFDQKKQEGEVDEREMANGDIGTKSREPSTKYLIRSLISRDGGC